jgi:DNA-binding NarL/FixJ family response regulator
MGPVELWLGKANRHLRRLDKAIADLAAAESACGVSGVAPFRVEAQLELAAARAGRGRQEDRQAARQLLVAAAASAARLGMPPFQAEIARLAGTLDDAGGAPALTRREREIAELVAEGMTNREIAQRLFLSERTAQNHVQHILDKLALSNRSQVAVWVERSRPPATPELSSRRSNPADDGARPHR